jgi:dipeptidase
MKTTRSIVLTLSLLVVSAATQVWACYAVIVGRGASADGSVLVGHNEENGGLRTLNFRLVPRRQFEKGAMATLRRGGTIPQVAETWSFLWSENPGLEFSDAYLNEWGVAIVSDSCPTREDDYDKLVGRGEIRDGGIGYMLRRLVAERATSAQEGVKLAGRLVQRFGYVHSGRTYVIADPNEAWLCAVVRGRRWVARRVPDDVVVLLPNTHIIEEVELDSPDSFLASPDLIAYAVQRGWFDPNGGQSFNFRRAYGLPGQLKPDPRRCRGRELVTGKSAQHVPGQSVSFGVAPQEKMTVASVANILRDRASERHISSPAVQEGAVFQLRPDMPKEVGCVYWRTTAEPSTSVFTPWYLGVTETAATYYRPVDIQTQLTLEHHFNPPPGTFEENPRLAWWTFKRLQDLVHEDPDRRIRLVQSEFLQLENHAFQMQKRVEEKAQAMWNTDRDLARKHLTRYCDATAGIARQVAQRLVRRFQTGPVSNPSAAGR